jgi:hypothetical protein
MRRGAALLREEEEGGLLERVQGVPGAPGEVLRRLLALSTRHGLTAVPVRIGRGEMSVEVRFREGPAGRVVLDEPIGR